VPRVRVPITRTIFLGLGRWWEHLGDGGFDGAGEADRVGIFVEEDVLEVPVFFAADAAFLGGVEVDTDEGDLFAVEFDGGVFHCGG
jgi:hypothetical protein